MRYYMNVQPGDILDHYADFPDSPLYHMSRYIVLSVNESCAELYILKGYKMEGLDNKQEPVVIADYQKPGDIEIMGLDYIESKEETTNNFYWVIDDKI